MVAQRTEGYVIFGHKEIMPTIASPSHSSLESEMFSVKENPCDRNLGMMRALALMSFMR